MPQEISPVKRENCVKAKLGNSLSISGPGDDVTQFKPLDKLVTLLLIGSVSLFHFLIQTFEFETQLLNVCGLFVTHAWNVGSVFNLQCSGFFFFFLATFMDLFLIHLPL